MNDQPPPSRVASTGPGSADHGDAPDEMPESQVRKGRWFSAIWVIPVVAALIAAFLGYRAIADRGPVITLTFRTADGLVADQTRVKHKAVDLGTVRSINLSRDMTHVDVSVQMRREAAGVLTDQARFWVVRARLAAANVSGLDTLISGSYIELDPGHPEGHGQQLAFTGLEDPPAVRSDEPGHTITLHADRIGSISSGSPVFYRDINAGEVLGYDLGGNGDGVTIHAFVRSPFDGFIRDNVHFWNVSGLSVEFGASGVALHFAGLQALVSGAIAFDIPPGATPGAPAKANAEFHLFPDEGTANTAGYNRRLRFVTYMEGSVRGLAVGAPVDLYGIRIGNVTDVQLQFDPSGGSSRVAVHLELQPERILRPEQIDAEKPLEVVQRLLDRGMRLQLDTTNYLTGQLAVSAVFIPDLPRETVRQEGEEIVVPSVPGGLSGITTGLSGIIAKLQRLPLDGIAKNLNDTLQGVSQLANGPELKQVLTSMSATLVNVQDLVRKTDTNLTPMLKRLPDIAAGLQTSVDRAARLVGSVDTGYGANSEFRRDLERLLVQVSDTARSVRLLADYLDQHPEALIRGRTDRASER